MSERLNGVEPTQITIVYNGWVGVEPLGQYIECFSQHFQYNGIRSQRVTHCLCGFESLIVSVISSFAFVQISLQQYLPEI